MDELSAIGLGLVLSVFTSGAVVWFMLRCDERARLAEQNQYLAEKEGAVARLEAAELQRQLRRVLCDRVMGDRGYAGKTRPDDDPPETDLTDNDIEDLFNRGD